MIRDRYLINRDEIEKYLQECNFSFKWKKDYLFIRKLGRGWKIPYYEFKYSCMSVEQFIGHYTDCYPGNGGLYETKNGKIWSIIPGW